MLAAHGDNAESIDLRFPGTVAAEIISLGLLEFVVPLIDIAEFFGNGNGLARPALRHSDVFAV